MNANLRIAARLLKIAKALVAMKREDIDSQIRRIRSDLPEQKIQEAVDCISKMPPKHQLAAVFWMRKKALSLPEQLDIFNDAMNLVDKQHLDFMKYDDPDQIVNRNDSSTSRIKNKSSFNPGTEPTFHDKKDLGNGVTVYTVDDTQEGMMAVRRAIDANWGENANPWCLVSRKNGLAESMLNDFSEEDRKALGLDEVDDTMQAAWDFWKNMYNAYPKRIAFKGGKLLAFSANSEPEILWFDRNNKPSKEIPGADIEDDIITQPGYIRPSFKQCMFNHKNTVNGENHP